MFCAFRNLSPPGIVPVTDWPISVAIVAAMAAAADLRPIGRGENIIIQQRKTTVVWAKV